MAHRILAALFVGMQVLACPSARAASLIRSTQRGTITMPQGGATSVSATITSVDVTKAVVVFGGCTSDTASTAPHDWLVRMELSSATTVTATRVYSGDGNILCTYQVVEYY